MNGALHATAFRGLDERLRFADDLATAQELTNYCVTETRTLRKRPGQRTVLTANAPIDGMWSGYLGAEHHFLYASAGKLYRANIGTGTRTELGSIGTGKCVFFEFSKKVYIKTPERYCVSDGKTVHDVTGYIPLVIVGSTPAGAGQPFEDVNMLTAYRRAQFVTNATDKVYHLPEKGLSGITGLALDGKNGAVTPSSVDSTNGTVTFTSPLGDGHLLEVTYRAKTDRRETILRTTGVMLFGGSTDGHVFLWGDAEQPNVRYHSELADGQPSAEYFPENNYTVIGDSEITDIVSQYDRQLIFTKDRAFYSYCELQTDTLGNTYASFPVYNLNGEKGNLLRNAGCIMENDPVTLCADGLNRWTSTTVENERNAKCFSEPVGETMRGAIAYMASDEMCLFNLRATGELFFFYGGIGALVYRYRVGAWYKYVGLQAKYPVEYGGKLYFASMARIVCLDPDVGTDVGEPFDATWTSPYLTLAGERVKPSRLDWTVHACGDVCLQFSFDGEQLPSGVSRGHERVDLSCGDGRVVGGSLRCDGLPTADRVRLSVLQTDASTDFELCELKLLAIRKGRYLRHGIHHAI